MTGFYHLKICQMNNVTQSKTQGTTSAHNHGSSKSGQFEYKCPKDDLVMFCRVDWDNTILFSECDINSMYYDFM